MKDTFNKVTEKLFNISFIIMLVSMVVTVVTALLALFFLTFIPILGETIFKITSFSSWCWVWSMLPTGIFGIIRDFFD